MRIILTAFDDDYVKAIMIEPQILNDPYVQSSIYQMIVIASMKPRSAYSKYMGTTPLSPATHFSLCQHIFGLEVTWASEVWLKSTTKYWCDQHAERLACYRAPMTCHNNIRLVFPHRSDEASH